MSFYKEHLVTAGTFAAIAFVLGAFAKSEGFFRLPKKNTPPYLSLAKVLGFFGVYVFSVLPIPLALMAVASKGLLAPFWIQPLSMLACFFFSGCFLLA